VRLPEYLPDVIAGRYPEQPVEIELAHTAVRPTSTIRASR
jgi:hypothetical protein